MPCPSPTRLSAPDFAHLQDGRTQKLEKAKVSLNDCLACSGCVTSAETVLITQQSHEELRKVLDANKVSSGDQTQLSTAYFIRGSSAGSPVWLPVAPASLGFVTLMLVTLLGLELWVGFSMSSLWPTVVELMASVNL